MPFRTILLSLAFAAASFSGLNGLRAQAPAAGQPPGVEREFRAAWIATVSNIDWPSKRGLSTEQQQRELIAILDRVASLNMNAVVFQVRPACDALYESKLEPWSEYLTGQMGKPPEPYYDPLAFAVAEAHKRGLELHAWFNPYRVRHTSAKGEVSPRHISKTQPQVVRRYGRYLWLDPAEPAVQRYSRNVILDVVRRYDVDGVHMDDYFYPYQEKGEDGKLMDFPDDATWKRYVAGGGKLSRGDWRRENVNVFVRDTYRAVKAEKPWVKYGISPFGIWRPNNPEQIRGLDAYNSIYADSKKWLNEGWLDYFAPQLYWAIDPPQQSFPVLLKWWAEQNHKRRHLWPGMNSSRLGTTDTAWEAKEILRQIELTRKEPGSTGHIHWNVSAIMRNRVNIADELPRQSYAAPALVPASPWLSASRPQTPRATLSSSERGVEIKWQPPVPQDRVYRWIVQTRVGNQWRTEILPAGRTSHLVTGTRPTAVAVTAVNRFGNDSSPAVLAVR
jgi:uncharacterized lipoprotein YddW (UPF0748 family)